MTNDEWVPGKEEGNDDERALHLGIVTDEISRDLDDALTRAEGWGIRHFELREGRERRFPYFTGEETAIVEAALREGARVTAVSPGLFKGYVEDAAQVRKELEEVMPRAVEAALRFEAPVMILFGFTRDPNAPPAHRLQVLRAFEAAVEQAAAAGLRVAFENEPDFWIDDPAGSMALLDELDHPAAGLNWDPANLHWSGRKPEREDFDTIRPRLLNVHVKDFTPDDPDVPWRPVGQGITPWPDLLGWIAEDTSLDHVTLETHCEPLVPNTEASLEYVRDVLG